VSSSDLKITYEPFKQIVVMEKTKFASAEELARFTSVIAGGKLAGLYWVDGVIFLYFPLTASTGIVSKELLENRKVYWTFLGYAFMTNYQQVIETKEKMIVPVVNISSDEILKKVAQWLKQQEAKTE
jgi:hypothetical protein